MIYLIEDKTSRRIKSGWSDERINEYKDCLMVLDCYEKLSEYEEHVLSNNCVILYHESFVNPLSYENKKSVEKLVRSAEYRGNMVACFSGSKSQRTLDGNICNLPPNVLYQNLECFVKNYRKGDVDFKYLMFGENPELEDRLLNAINNTNIANANIGKTKTDKKLFFFVASDNELVVPFEYNNRTDNIKENGDFDFDCDDANLCDVISKNLKEKYDGIYIPLCFGETLSDFMGLRMAMLVRLSCETNRTSPIVIYGEASYDDMLSNECFDILKMPGVYYVHSDYKSLVDIANRLTDITLTDYKKGLENIHLNIPSDIGDNHGIANKWAIHRWASVLKVSDSDIDKNEEKVLTNLYFLYASALHSVEETKPITTDKALTIRNSDNQPPLKVLYIDDQADDGWYELLCSILYDRNNISLNYIGDKLKTMTPLQIMDCVAKEIATYNPNVVILDLRLHQSDFGNISIENITGYKILEKIKKQNRGIQVLVFSATNKVWNLQQLIKAEADGFIVKESLTDSFGPTFTGKTIRHIVSCLSECAEHTYRVNIWQRMQEDKLALKNQSRSHQIDKKYAASINNLLEMAEDSMFANGMKYTYASVFMHLFSIVETIAKQKIDDKPKYDENNGRYYFRFRSDDDKILSFNGNEPLGPLDRLTYKQKIHNLLYRIDCNRGNVDELVDKRNRFIHPNMIDDSELEKITVKNVMDIFDIVDNLIKKQ